MVETHHDDGGHHRIHEVERGGYAGGEIVIAVNEEEGGTVGEEGEIGQRDEFPATDAEIGATPQHDEAYDEGGESETVEKNGGI